MSRSIFTAVGALVASVGLVALVIAVRPEERPLAPIATPTPTAAASTAAVPSTDAAAASPSASPLVLPIPEGYRIQIPRLLIDLPIAEGDIEQDVVRQQTPENFAFHFPGTGLPGAGTNSYLYAHARRGMFLALWNARLGDQIVISTPTGSALKYVITEIHPRVPPADTSWLQPTPSERLTLQTSTGPNRDDPRFVVVATPS